MSGQLKEVRTRIKSVGTTQQITKAMKMVSAAKLRRAQDAITQMRPYAEKLQEMLGNIIGSLEGNMGGGLTVERPIEKVLFIVITSDRGLCGAFNANSIKLAKSVIKERYADQHQKGNVHILPLGKKAYESFERQGFKLVDDFWGIFSDLSFEAVRKVAEHVRAAFVRKEYDRVELVYSKFKNAATQEFICEQHLPIPKSNSGKKQSNNDFIFEPSKEVLIQELMPKILNTQIYKGLLDSNASEHGARMTAMDKATENAEEMLKTLKISYNRARQAAITTELTEIVSGAAALQG
ncbi:MAG: ATP synthase F1 subunit gamma [Chitinophagaceae bacterium]|nr:ATP synthase F1 subunit gamma [Chitinophagaceae bacterium]